MVRGRNDVRVDCQNGPLPVLYGQGCLPHTSIPKNAHQAAQDGPQALRGKQSRLCECDRPGWASPVRQARRTRLWRASVAVQPPVNGRRFRCPHIQERTTRCRSALYSADVARR